MYWHSATYEHLGFIKRLFSFVLDKPNSHFMAAKVQIKNGIIPNNCDNLKNLQTGETRMQIIY